MRSVAAFSSLVAVVATLLLAGCDSLAVSTPEPVTLTIGGATAMRPVLRALADDFSRQHPNVSVSLLGGGSTLGEASVRNGELQLGASTLFPPEQRTGAGDLISPTVTADPLRRTPIGLDGIAVIVHATNDVDELSLVQLQDLFSGKVLDWQALGSNSGEVRLVSREDGSGSRALFEERVMGDERVSLTAVVMPTSEDVVTYVAANPQAIGYVSRGHLAPLLAAFDAAGAAMPSSSLPVSGTLASIRIVAVEGVLPVSSALREQRYPLTQPLYLITQGPPTGWLRQFLDFTLSPAGQTIVGRYHVPIR